MVPPSSSTFFSFTKNITFIFNITTRYSCIGAINAFCCQDDVQQEQTEQETLEKITRELQENGWQLLFNGLTIRRDSVDTSRRIVRLECLNHIRQQLDKLYALESTLDNCPPKLQPLSSRDMPRNEERQQSQHQLEQKTTDS